MRSILNLPVRRVWIGTAVVFVVGVAVGMALTRSSEAAMQAPERLFSSEVGLMFNPIRPDRTADFEEVLGKLREALQQSENAVRKQQLNGWKVFKSTTPVQGNIMYIFSDGSGREGRQLRDLGDSERSVSNRGAGALREVQRGVQRRAEHHGA